VTDRVVGRRVVRLGRVGSTMDEAARLAAAGEPEGTVVVAAEQTNGRGRAGRSWHAPPGTALLCSVLLRPAVPALRLSVLPLLVGVAVAEAIEDVGGPPARLKWPNDVWLGGGTVGRKVAGILVTARPGVGGGGQVVIGVGLNANVPPDGLPPGATSLLAETGRLVALDRLLGCLLVRLDAAYRAFVVAAGAPSLDAWRARAALLGEPVTIEQDGRRLAGVMRGVDDDGALLLEGEGGAVERVVAGDLVRGPVLQDALVDIETVPILRGGTRRG